MSVNLNLDTLAHCQKPKYLSVINLRASDHRRHPYGDEQKDPMKKGHEAHKNAAAKHAFGRRNYVMLAVFKDKTPSEALVVLEELISNTAFSLKWGEICVAEPKIKIRFGEMNEGYTEDSLIFYWTILLHEIETLNGRLGKACASIALIKKIMEVLRGFRVDSENQIFDNNTLVTIIDIFTSNILRCDMNEETAKVWIELLKTLEDDWNQSIKTLRHGNVDRAFEIAFARNINTGDSSDTYILWLVRKIQERKGVIKRFSVSGDLIGTLWRYLGKNNPEKLLGWIKKIQPETPAS